MTFFIFINIEVCAQVNLVRNPSFEHIDSCRFPADNIMAAFPWDSLVAGRGGVSELLSTKCPPFAINFGAGVQYPRTGNSLATLYVYNTSDVNTYYYQRDYLQEPLSHPLFNKKSYCVTFYLQLQNTSGIAIDRVGAYFDNGTLTTQSYYAWAIANAQIESPHGVFLNDTTNWVKVQGIITANGGEAYITIGNFRDNINTDTIMFPPPILGMGNIVYYFVDDVSVVESNTKIDAGRDTAITQGDTIELGKITTEGLPCEWYDMAGNKIGRGSTALVHPTSNTKYVVKMDLCGFVSYDTVEVKVYDVGIKAIRRGDVSIYPNPVNNDLNLQLQSNAVCQINLMDLQGKQLYSQNASKSLVISTLLFTNGLYILECINLGNNDRRFIKIVVDHEQ